MKKTITMVMALCMLCTTSLGMVVSADEADDMIVTGSGTFTVQEAAERAIAWQECANLAGKHEAYHSAIQHRAELENCWVTEEPWTESMSWTNNSQFMYGMENVYAFYTGVETEVENWLSAAQSADTTGLITATEDWYGTGILWYHMLMSPVIEVAGDGQTAVGLWQSFGTVTGPQDGGMSATWTMEDYTMAFAKQSDGEWRIWHLRTFVHFYTEVGEHWYESNQASASKPEVAGYDDIAQGMGESPDGESPDGESPEGESPAGESPDGAGPGGPGGPDGAGPSMNQDYAVNGKYYVGYSLYDVPVLATIPEPYETWDDIKDSFAWGEAPLLGNNELHDEVMAMR